MSVPLTRIYQLREFRRHEEAIAMIMEALAQEPENPVLYKELALNRIEQNERKQALKDINRAIALAPESPMLFVIKAHILCSMDQGKDAMAAAMRALELDPEEPEAWNAKSMAHCELSEWRKAEEAAREALELDPDDPTASNLLAHSLRLQNRLDESEQESRRRLERDPENAYSFSTAGWAALQRHQPREAEKLFLEALRLDSEPESARIGLREAYKARSAFYRLYLKWVFFIQRHSERNQWLIIIGIYIGYKFGVTLLRQIHPLVALPLVIAYMLFVFGSWLANGLGHFLILKDPIARMSLNHKEKMDGILVGGLFFIGSLIGLIGLSPMAPLQYGFLGLVIMGSAVPASRIFSNASKIGVAVFGGITAMVIIFGLMALGEAAPAGSDSLMTEKGSMLLGLSAVGVAITTWIAAIPALRERD